MESIDTGSLEKREGEGEIDESLAVICCSFVKAQAFALPVTPAPCCKFPATSSTACMSGLVARQTWGVSNRL